MRAAWALALVAACTFPTKNLVGGGDGGGGSDAMGSGSGSDTGHMLVVIGGGEGDWGLPAPATATIPDVIAASIHTDGTLGAWEMLPDLPQAYVHTNPAVVVGHFAYILGEFGTTSSGAMPTVLLADLSGSRMWATTTALMAPQGGYQSSYGGTTDGTYVVVTTSNGTSVWQSKAISTGGLESWSTAPALPLSLSSTAALVTGGNVYVLGESSGMLAIVYAPLSSTGVGAWVNPGVTTTSVGYVIDATVWQSHVYVIGGFDGGNFGMTTVSMSTIASGTPGAFAVQAPLPQGRGNACVIAGDNAIYVIGGEPGSGSTSSYDTVYYALPAPDGAIGRWDTTTQLPSSRSGVSCVIL